MTTVRDVQANKFINKLKDELKKFEEIKQPQWSKFTKSGSHKERPPEQEDFWYIRAASILRRAYIERTVGVERLRSYYGGRKSMGSRPPHFRKSGGSVIRKILQQLEKAGLIEKAGKGRKITDKGRKLLDRTAYEVSK